MNIPGPITQINLADISPIFGADGKKPEGLSRSAACLSLELATAAYSMDTAPWQSAGWRDFSILADSDLLTGSALNGPATSPLEGLSRGVRQTLTHMRVTMRDPVTQYLGFKRQQDENASACKSVVMARRCGAQTVIAISFKGTGKRLFDWIPNLRIRPENGYHGGFAQLASQFLAACGRIDFPETAREMGLPKLTLALVLTYMRSPSSPFRLWICGHSQGSAVAQIFIDYLVKSGVSRECVSGFGFASPTVTEEPRQDAWKMPMKHILNADDVVPRVGFTDHLGSCYLFVPDDGNRAELYGGDWDSPCFREMLSFYREVDDTDDALLTAMAALDLIGDQSSESLRRFLSGTEALSFLPEWAKLDADITIPGVNALARQLRDQYRTVTGLEDFPQEELAAARARFGDMEARYGLTNWFSTLLRAVTLPHRMYGIPAKGEDKTAYQYIVIGHSDELVQADHALGTGGFRHVMKPVGLTVEPVKTGKAPAVSLRHQIRRPAVPGPARPASDRPAVRLTLPGTQEPKAPAPDASSGPEKQDDQP